MDSERSAPANRALRAAATAIGALAVLANPTASARDDEGFRVHSTTFVDGSTLPLSMVDQYPPGGPNLCTVDGSAGGNSSPELSWDHVPDGTRSFAVVSYDVTASFVHWSIYNISPSARGLPANAGSASGTYGVQVYNDFPSFGYEGPCPPPGVTPFAHRYVFTVYALDKVLTPPVFANFPQDGHTLERALLEAALGGHVLAKASIGGYFSTTPP
jgi:Raf kinase inhibitor-like YbhB/YbcL family protein